MDMNTDELELLGKHLILDLSGCTRNLGDVEALRKLGKEIVYQINMTPILPAQLVYWDNYPIVENSGVSYLQMIAESHVAIHAFDKKGWVFADISSCMPYDTDLARDLIVQHFGAANVSERVIPRGIGFPRNIGPRIAGG